MTERFDKCVEIILAKEAGYVNHPKDPGKATKYGITMATLAGYRLRNVTVADVKNLTVAEAKAIYFKNYWKAMKCDSLAVGVDLVVFDAAVNSGCYQATKWLQRAVGATSDGSFGPATLSRVQAMSKLGHVVIYEVCRLRLQFCLSLDNEAEEAFEKGWGARILSILQTATRMYETQTKEK